MEKPKKVPDFLRDAAAIYEQRNALYGDNYKRFGLVMVALFPHGMNLESSEDWNRAGIFVQMVSKITRYANCWSSGHDDSLDDLSVYTMMLRELDEESFNSRSFLKKDLQEMQDENGEVCPHGHAP